MTRFSAIAHTPDGRTYLKHNDVSHFELRLAVKVGIGVGFIALAVYLISEYVLIALVLNSIGLTILIATGWNTYFLIGRDIDAHREKSTPVTLPVGGGDSEPTRVIPVNSGGVTTQMVIDVKDDELVKLILKLLDASMKISSGDTSVFPAYRSLNMSYKDYDAALRGLGSLVKRERGTSPYLVHPNTMQSTRQMLATGTSLPYRSDATPSENRLNGA